MKPFVSIAVTLSLVLLAACSSATEEPAEPVAAVTVPSSIFVTASADAVPLAAAKANAKPGDKVVFEAKIGGRRETFVENRAIFFVADSSLKSCDEIPGDTCKFPWDYCCEPPDSRTKNMGTVQVVDGSGQPLKTSLENSHGLAPLKTVVVTGTVDQSEGGNFVVNAESIHVKEG